MSCVDLHKKTILVTGAGGFIGSNLVKRLYDDVKDVTVIGIDNMNDYYDVRLKESRLAELSVHPSFVFIKGILFQGIIRKYLSSRKNTDLRTNLSSCTAVISVCTMTWKS